MKEGSRDFFVGLVSIVGLLGIVMLLILFGEMDRFIQPRYPITIVINDAAGLIEGSAVTLNGVPVGMVERVSLERDPEKSVRVVAQIDEHIEIPSPAVAKVQVSLLGGRSTLLLEADFSPEATTVYVTDGSAIIEGEYVAFADELAAKLEGQMQPIFDAFEDFSEFSTTFAELGQNINELVKPGEGEENLREVMSRLTTTLDQVSVALELANSWLGDEQLKTNVRDAVANANELLKRSTQAVDEFAAIAKNLDGRTEEVASRLVAVSDELALLLEDVNGLVDRTAAGEGTLGKLMTSPDLYNSLNDAALRLEQALREAQLLIQKLREEGVNIKL